MNEAEKGFKEIGTISKRFTIPILIWEEWEKDCKSNFANSYASKMMYDHKFRVEMAGMLSLLASDIAALQEEVFDLKASQSQKTEMKTFGE